MSENTYSFDLPTYNKSIIKVIGVGGGGSNAVNHMFGLGIKDVEFVVCNTDAQALESSLVPNKLQIGIDLTEGLGAGANPEKGRNAAIESKEDIRDMLSEDTKMVFITAGMGGGTGTGAAPVIAQVANELDILTVGIVTAPFGFEGKKKMSQANDGIVALKEHCDTVLVILNDKIKEEFGNLTIREAFAQADNVLTTAAKGIAEIITVPGYVNVDFEDVKTVMKNAGAAVMGSAATSGDHRARRAAEMSINSPLLNNQNIHGADKILLSIMSGEEAELQMDELSEITDYIEEFAGEDAEVIFGHGIDPALGDEIRVTVIATGFASTEEMKLKMKPKEEELIEDKQEMDEVEEMVRKVIDLESEKEIKQFSIFEGEENDPVKEGQDAEILDESLFEEINQEPTEEEEKSYVFVSRGDIEEKDEEKEIFKIEDHFDEDDFDTDEAMEFHKSEEEADAVLDELTEGAAIPPSRKLELMEERRKREQLLDETKSTEMLNPETFKHKWETPAYLRKKVTLEDVPHSSERNISKYSLTDDNQILGNNKFLHDNVD